MHGIIKLNINFIFIFNQKKACLINFSSDFYINFDTMDIIKETLQNQFNNDLAK